MHCDGFVQSEFFAWAGCASSKVLLVHVRENDNYVVLRKPPKGLNRVGEG